MPKIISESDKQKVKDLMHEKVISLIKKKGIIKITVDDIVKAVAISKGSFYSYYKSKEELIYEVLKRCEKNAFTRVMALNFNENKIEVIRKAFYNIYLEDDSLALYFKPQEYMILLQKLPNVIYEQEKEKSENNFQKTLECLGINPLDCDINVLSQLMDSLQFIASNKSDYSSGNQKALEIIINSISEYLAGSNGMNSHDEN